MTGSPWSTPEATNAPPPKSASSGLSIGKVLAIVAGVAVAAFIGLAMLGTSLLEEQIGKKLEKHPEVIKAVGTVESVDFDMMRSFADPDPELVYYDFYGTAGKATIAVKSDSVSAEDEEITYAALISPSGEKIVLIGD